MSWKNVPPKVERGAVVLLADKVKVDDKWKRLWKAEVGGLSETDRFMLPRGFRTAGEALDASIAWAKQRNLTLCLDGVQFTVMGAALEDVSV